MPKKKTSLNGTKGEQARVRRAEIAIEEILTRENVVITASKLRVMFANADGKFELVDVVSCRGLAQLVDRPNMLIVPQVQLQAKKPESEPRHTKD